MLPHQRPHNVAAVLPPADPSIAHLDHSAVHVVHQDHIQIHAQHREHVTDQLAGHQAVVTTHGQQYSTQGYLGEVLQQLGLVSRVDFFPAVKTTPATFQVRDVDSRLIL